MCRREVPGSLCHFLAILLFAMMPAAHAHEAVSIEEELGHGYAMLHDALKRLQHLDKVLLIKKERPPVGEVIRNLADTSDMLNRDLVQLAEKYPAIRLDDQGLTRFEVKKRESLMLDRGLSLGMPLLGKTGAEMERTALLSLSAAINQQRYLIAVMLPDEFAEERKKWLERSSRELDAIYAAMLDLLQRDYFCESVAQKR